MSKKTFRKAAITTMAATTAVAAVAPTAFAAEKSFSDLSPKEGSYEAIMSLVGQGIINGYEDGTFRPWDKLNRSQAAALLTRAKGLTAPADLEAALAGYSDVSVNHENAKEIAAVTEAGYFSGNSGKFMSYNDITREQMAKVLVKAFGLDELGYEDVDVNLDNVDPSLKEYVQVLANTGVTTELSNFKPGDKVNRAQFATFLDRAMNVEAVAPKVVSVDAINATQVEVKFNTVLDGSDFDTQAEAASIFKLTGETVVSADLSDDEKTVVVTFAGSIEDTNDEFIVEPVMTTKKDANNQPIRTLKHVQVFTYEDTVKPEIVSVSSTSKSNTATSVTVVASEPIQSAVAKINGSYVTVNFGGTDTATITGLNLDATKEHTLELINLTDKAATPNVTVSTSKKFNVTVDATAPVVSSVSTASEKEILLTFSKKMDEATLESAFATGAGLGLVKDETLSNLQLGTYAGTVGYVKEVAGSKGTQFTVQVSASLFSNKSTRNLTVLLPDSITDSLGNKLSVTTKTVTLTKDTTKPVATGYRVVKDSQDRVTQIEVDFSEGLAAGTVALPTIVNENGVAVSAASFLGGLTPVANAAGDKKVVYTATTPAKVAGKYAFSFGQNLVSDQAETANRSEAFNYTIDFGSSNATFNLVSAAATSPTSNTIAVNFGTAVKGGAVSNSATDLNNYTLGGKPLPTGTTITLNAAQTIATIVLPAESVEKTDGTSVFTVSNVDSLTGAKLNAYNGTVAISDNVKPVLTSGTLTSDNKLAIGFSEALAVAPAINDLVIKINGTTVTAAAAGAGTGTNLTVTAGTGSDAGKYLINLDDLVIQGANVPATPGTPGNDGPDGLPGTADDVAAIPGTPGSTTETFVDLNNNGVYDAATDIKIGDGPVADFKFSTSALISGVTVTTASGTLTAADAANNTLTNATTITVK